MIGGGRYDGLIESLGGPHTPAVGWAGGIERLAMLLDAPATARHRCGDRADGRRRPRPRRSASLAALRRRRHRRRHGVSRQHEAPDAEGGASGARYAVILGDDELARGEAAVVKDARHAATQRDVPLAEPRRRRCAPVMTRISAERIAAIEARKEELQEAMSAPDLAPDAFVRLSKDYAEILPVAEAAREVRRLRAEIEVLERDDCTRPDEDIREMAVEELAELRRSSPRPSARWR